MIEMIGNVVLNYKYYSGMDLYSDGEVEEKILDIVKNNPVNNYNKIIAQENEWPILYHLSELRSNIISWIPISKEETVLEIGSGCGAITGQLSEMTETVTCIELSKRRSLINAYRNQEKKNIEIIVGNFEDIKVEEQYDYITLIGVYEYAESYISKKNPYKNMLKNLRKYLKPSGKIIIAIENKMGLKYWAGCKEDHVGRYFEGIEGYRASQGVKTFSKNEMEELIKSSGYNDFKFYYPYPDYKLPTTIYSDKYLPKIGELSNNMRNFDNDRVILFNESKVFDEVIKDGLFPLYSNSFLIIIENKQEDYHGNHLF